jgi:hypothetical protein
VKRCASAGPRFTWPCHRPGELCGEPRAACDSLTAQTRPAPIFAAKHPGPRGETLRSTRGQRVVVLKNTGRKHGTRLGGRGRHGSTQLPGSPARKVTTNLPYLLHTVALGKRAPQLHAAPELSPMPPLCVEHMGSPLERFQRLGQHLSVLIKRSK